MLHYRRVGKGKTVVLQHGFVGGGGYFLPLSRYLSGTYDVISTDLPGFAGSSDVPAPDTIEGFAAALVETLENIGVTEFSLLGHSIGSMVSLQAALDYPDRVSRLILYGSTPTGEIPERFETIDESVKRIGSDGIDRTAARIAATWFINGKEDPFYEFTRAAGAGANQDSAIRCLRSLSTWDVRSHLKDLVVPTLVICGDTDRNTHPDWSIELWKNIQGSELCVLPGCAHIAHLELSEVFNRVIDRFLRKSL